MNTKYDITIVGAGMVGLSLAAALANTSLRIAIIDTKEKSDLATEAETRVSAINLASQQFLQNSGVWSAMEKQRLCAYNKMQVLDKDSFGKIHFSADELHQTHLGHIIENTVIRNALWNKVAAQANAKMFVPEQVNQLIFGEQENFVTLESGEAFSTQWLIAADGANSWLRQQADIPLTFWDYDHSALVATIKTELPHDFTARQVFLPDGPLAFLPLYQNDLCSIVWSMPPEKAEQLVKCTETDFNKQLAVAFGLNLGLCKVQGQRLAIPLKMRYARDFVMERIILIGDAAHTIHPLAGQGVNLGLMDAAALADCFQQSTVTNELLRKFERWRKAEAVEMIAAMESFKFLFAGNDPVKKLVRGIGLSVVDKLSPIKTLFAQQALGLKGD